MNYEEYRQNHFTDPQPPQKFGFVGIRNAVLFFEDYQAAVEYYTQIFGPPGYVEGENTRGWQVGDTWLTLFPAKDGGPKNVEINLVMKTPQEAERLQQAFMAAGGRGASPSDELMYIPIRYCPVTDPFGTSILIYSPMEM